MWDKEVPGIQSSSTKSSPLLHLEDALSLPERSLRGSQSGYFTARNSISVSRGPQAGSGVVKISSPAIRGSPSPSHSGRSADSDSSTLLSPPIKVRDTEGPPYKARSDSSGSLNFMRRVTSLPEELRKTAQDQRSPRHYHERRSHLPEHQYVPYWWLPQPKRDPKSKEGAKQLRSALRQRFRTKEHENAMLLAQGSHNPFEWESTASRIVIRRWSSMDIMFSDPELHNDDMPERMQTTYGKPAYLSFIEQRLPPSQFSSISIPHRPPRKFSEEMVDVIRKTLMARRVHTAHRETPTEITLRRATTLSSDEASRKPSFNEVNSSSEVSSGGTTPRARQVSQTPASYLITSKDIRIVTQLIQSKLEGIQARQDPSVTTPRISVSKSAERSRSTSFTAKGLIVARSGPSISSPSVLEVESSVKQPHHAAVLLHAAMTSQKQSQETLLSRILPRRSRDEIIWQNVAHSTHNSMLVRSPANVTITTVKCKEQAVDHPDTTCCYQNSVHAFDPDNAAESIRSWRSSLGNQLCQKNLSSMECLDAQSPSPRKALNPRDVVSFPPLPRRTTTDWFSPLPGLSDTSSITSQPAALTLHELGIDACFGTRGDAKSPTTASLPSLALSSTSGLHQRDNDLSPLKEEIRFNIPFASETTTPEETTLIRGMAFEPLSDHVPTPFSPSIGGSQGRRRSVNKFPSRAAPSTVSHAHTGSSINASSGVRRRSSTHVAVIDNPQKGERLGKWVKPRQDSAYPAPLKFLLDTDLNEPGEEASHFLGDVLRNTNLRGRKLSPPKHMRSGTVSRMNIIRDKSPPAGIDECAGIYAQMTGSLKVSESCRHHHEEALKD